MVALQPGTSADWLHCLDSHGITVPKGWWHEMASVARST